MRGTPISALLLASTMLTAPAFAAINAADYGVTPGAADNGPALQRAFDAAQSTSDHSVTLPSGTIAYGRQLTANGVRVSGSGGTVLAPSDPRNQRITLTGNSPSLSNMRINYHPIARSGSDHGRNGVWVERATGFNVSGVTLDGSAYGVPPQGQGAGDLFVYNSQNGTISNNNISYTWADSIHMTGGSRNISVTGNRIDHSGDDGIATVSYGDDTGNIRISGNTVTNNMWGRNITAVGTSDVEITNNLISGNASDGAGVYVASEPAYNTPPPRNVLVQGNTIQDTGGAGKGHGQIMLWSGRGPLSNITVRDNDVRDSERDDLAVVVSGAMNGVTVDGNNIDGEITRRNGGSYNGSGNTINDSSMANSVPVPAGTPAPAPGGTDGSQFGMNLNNVERNLYDTDDQFWNAVERGDAQATRRLNDLVSGGILFRQGNQIINRVTGQVTSTVNRTIGDAVDTVVSPVEDAVSSLGDAVLCRIGGGWVSALIGINVCAAKQLKIQGRQLETQQRMVAGLGANAAAAAAGIEGVARQVLGSIDSALYGENADEVVGDRYQSGMPESWTFEDSAEHMAQMRQQTDLATREAARAQAVSRSSIDAALQMSDEALELSQGAEGQTQAIQAQTQMLRSQIAVAAAQQAADAASATAQLRTTEEQRAQDVIANQKIERFYGPGSLDLPPVSGRALFQ
jgi:hypothetical protein